MSAQHTPAAQWVAHGLPDPHGNRYDCERAALAMGNLTDDELANGVFLHGDGTHGRAPIAEVVAGRAFWPIAWLTAAKDRIRWLSRALVREQATTAELLEALETARNGLRWYQEQYPQEVNGCDGEAMQQIDAAIAKATGSAAHG